MTIITNNNDLLIFLLRLAAEDTLLDDVILIIRFSNARIWVNVENCFAGAWGYALQISEALVLFENGMIVGLFLLKLHHDVTDRQTDSQDHAYYCA